jgi:hypothetical protein
MWLAAQEAGRGDELVVGVEPLLDVADGFGAGVEALALAQTKKAHPGMVHFNCTTDDLRKLSLGRSFRIVDVDGDHTEEWARKDMAFACSVVVDGGLIVLHDAYPDAPACWAIWQQALAGLMDDVSGVRLEPVRLVKTLAIMRAVVL